MNLSSHFTLDEATVSDTAVRMGIDNQPGADVVENMMRAAERLENVRQLLGAAIIVTSWFRCEAVNRAIGGAHRPGIDHSSGWCIDFKAPAFGTPLEVCRAIRDSGIKFDQLIYEGTWTHISFATPMRQMILTAHFGSGKATYTAGLA